MVVDNGKLPLLDHDEVFKGLCPYVNECTKDCNNYRIKLPLTSNYMCNVASGLERKRLKDPITTYGVLYPWPSGPFPVPLGR